MTPPLILAFAIPQGWQHKRAITVHLISTGCIDEMQKSISKCIAIVDGISNTKVINQQTLECNSLYFPRIPFLVDSVERCIVNLN